MKIVHAALVCCVLLSSGRVDAEEHPTTFRLLACKVRAEYVSLVFKDEAGHGRHIAFMDGYKEMLLESPSTKGLLKWGNTVAIHITPSTSGDDHRLMAIEYRNDGDSS